MNYALKMRALGLGEIHPQSQSNQESVEIPLNKDTTKTTEFTDGNFETAKEKKIKKQKRRHSEGIILEFDCLTDDLRRQSVFSFLFQS
jgi:hypothetical protein